MNNPKTTPDKPEGDARVESSALLGGQVSTAEMIGNLNKSNGHRPECKCRQCLVVYLFFREDMFYPLELNGDAVAIANAECNPGTIRVENAITREVVWPPNV